MTSNLIIENGRVKNVTYVKPIVYGNVARYFGKKRESDGHTHQWTIYVKPFDNEDMSLYVKKVHFKLHDSYANPNRIVTCPPYEVSETGWGEFESTIRIYFLDQSEKPVVLYHVLKLFQNDPLITSGKKSLVSEYYDEIIFQEPSALMHKVLSNPKPLTSNIYQHETDFSAKKQRTLDAITHAKAHVAQEINEMRECLTEARDLIQTYQLRLTEVGDTNRESQGTISVASNGDN